MEPPTLNEDIFSHLVQFVPSLQDVLSIALANSKLFSLVKQDLKHRTIRCHLDNNAVWNYLIANPEMAARVRELELLRENPRSTPPSLRRVPSDELKPSPLRKWLTLLSPQEIEPSEKLLIKALRVMVNLEGFTWDQWVPVINVGKGDEANPFTEDVWTALRDYTQIQRLSVVDLGDGAKIVDNPIPIFRSSSLFSIRNLTHIRLKVYYVPLHPDEGVFDEDDDLDSDLSVDGAVRPPRVDIGPLKSFLLGSPNLQSLTLTIIDRSFHWDHGGNPYTNISPILAEAHWPSLQHLDFWELTVDSPVMADFLRRHPTVLSLSAHLSVEGDELPSAPFSFSHVAPDPSTQFLPNINSLDLQTDVLRSMIPHISYPWSIRSIGLLEPQDWGANDPINSVATDAASHPFFELDEMPNLRDILVTRLQSFSELEKLVVHTPNLQVFHLQSCDIPDLHKAPNPHQLWLPYLSRWPELTTLHGVTLWSYLTYPRGIPEEVLWEVANVYPKLRHLGGGVKIHRLDNGHIVVK